MTLVSFMCCIYLRKVSFLNALKSSLLTAGSSRSNVSNESIGRLASFGTNAKTNGYSY